jgi:hypothetical protein
MKLYKISILIIFAALCALVACSDDDENVGKGESINDFTLSSPAIFSTIVLNPGTVNAPITLAWQAAVTGLRTEPTYYVLLDKKGGDFSAPLLRKIADGEGKSRTVTLTTAEVIAAINGTTGTQFIWTVEAITASEKGENVKRATLPYDLNLVVSTVDISMFAYTSPSVNQKLSLNTLITPNEEIEFEWEAATSSEGTVNYVWQAATTPNGFTNPVLEFPSDDEGSANTFTITHRSLAEALGDIDYVDGLYWRVLASVDDFSFAPETRFVWFEIVDIQAAYAVGSFNGWNNGCGATITLDNKGGGVFEKLVAFPADTEFKFLLNCGSWDNAYGIAGSTPPTLGADTPFGGDNIKITAAGNYIIRINFVASTFRVTAYNPPANLFLVGGSSPAGWSPENSSPFKKISDGNFEMFVKLNAGDGIKFLQVQDWAGDWGADPANITGGIVQEGESNVPVTESGFYRIQVNFSDFSYKLLKTSWGVVGSATPGGWDTDTDMTQIENHKWEVIMTLGAGEFKFRANDEWEIAMGPGSQTDMVYGGGNFNSPGPGTYKIVMNLDPVTGYSYTITAQ